jgi:hypothetical protein
VAVVDVANVVAVAVADQSCSILSPPVEATVVDCAGDVARWGGGRKNG